MVGALFLSFERLLGFVPRCLLFLMVRAVFVEITLSEISERRYKLGEDKLVRGDDKEQAQFLFDHQEAVSSETDDKTKLLLALSASLATLALAFLRTVQPRWIAVLFTIALTVTVFLCLSIFDVRTYAVPTPTTAEPSADESTWADSLHAATRANRAGHHFRVDLYRAATRWFFIALLLSPIGIALAPNPSDRLTALLTDIDHQLHREVAAQIDRIAAPGPGRSTQAADSADTMRSIRAAVMSRLDSAGVHRRRDAGSGKPVSPDSR